MILQGLEYRQYRSRIHWIDIARCISMVIIVYAHTYDTSKISEFFHVFHVPVFFALSGFVWKKAKDIKTLLNSLVINLIIPYLVCSIVSIVAYQVMGSLFSENKLSLVQCIKGVIYSNSRTGLMQWNRPLWFIPCLFITKLLWEAISRINKEYYQYGVVALIVTVGAMGLKTKIASVMLPWETEISIHALLYYTIGVAISRFMYIYHNKNNIWTSKPAIWIIVVITFTICLLIYRYNPQPISMQYNHYGKYPLFVLGALAGTVFVGGISLLINKNRVLENVGQNTMGILLWHKFTILIFQCTKFGKDCIKSPDTVKSITIGIIVVILSIAMSLAIGMIIRKMLKLMKKTTVE